MDEDRLPKIVYEWDKSLNIEAWSSEIEHIFKKIDCGNTNMGTDTIDLEHASKKLLLKNQQDWRREGELKPKLRTFNKIHDFDHSQILVQAPVTRLQRSLLTQLKSGILPLKIETDRYQGIRPENRLCKICSLNQPEDELHFIFTCPALNHTRSSTKKFLNLRFTDNSEIQDLKSMFQSKNISTFAIYLENLYKARQKLIYG